MKKLFLVCVTIILTSCVTSKDSNTVEPLWFSDGYDYLSPQKFIVYRAKGESFSQAEEQIKRKSRFLEGYIEAEKVKEFIGNDGVYYLLYAIELTKLEDSLRVELSSIHTTYIRLELDGDTASSVLDKIASYEKAMEIFKSTKEIADIAKTTGLKIDPAAEFNLKELMDKIKFTRDNIVFSVKVHGDIDGAIASTVSRELHHLGYNTAKDGLVEIEADLNLTDVELGNNYVNKYWDLQLKINNIYGDTSNSVSFSGRESQIDEAALNRSIIRVVSKKVVESLNVIIP